MAIMWIVLAVVIGFVALGVGLKVAPKAKRMLEKRKENKEIADEFGGMSIGAKAFLSYRNPFSETGYYGNVPFRVILGNNGFLSRYSDSPLKSWAERDYKHIRNRKSDSSFDYSSKFLAEKKRVADYSRNLNFDLSEITDSEWKLIIHRYVQHMETLFAQEEQEIKGLSNLRKNSEHVLKKLDYIDGVWKEIRQLEADGNNDSISADSWDSEFNGNVVEADR